MCCVCSVRCSRVVRQVGTKCDICSKWCHHKCVWTDDMEYQGLGNSENAWFSPACNLLSFNDSLFECTANSVSSTLPLSPSSQISIFYITCRNLFPKVDCLRLCVAMSFPSLVALTETWLSYVLDSSEISISGYQHFHRDPNRHGVGLALYVQCMI